MLNLPFALEIGGTPPIAKALMKTLTGRIQTIEVLGLDRGWTPYTDVAYYLVPY